jgi:hypothetical protein
MNKLTTRETVHVTYIATTPERCWAALTPSDFTTQRSSHPIVHMVTLQSFLIDDFFQRRLEAGNIARVGAEIVRPEARHRTDVDSRLTGERP